MGVFLFALKNVGMNILIFDKNAGGCGLMLLDWPKALKKLDDLELRDLLESVQAEHTDFRSASERLGAGLSFVNYRIPMLEARIMQINNELKRREVGFK